MTLSVLLPRVLFPVHCVRITGPNALQIINSEGHATTLTATQIANLPHVTVDTRDHSTPARFEGSTVSCYSFGRWNSAWRQIHSPGWPRSPTFGRRREWPGKRRDSRNRPRRHCRSYRRRPKAEQPHRCRWPTRGSLSGQISRRTPPCCRLSPRLFDTRRASRENRATTYSRRRRCFPRCRWWCR